jgi:hypothetical protein
LRHRALNCPAGIVFMTTPDDHGHYSITMPRNRACAEARQLTV